MSLYRTYRFAYRPYQFFKVLGIPHPPVLPFIGNSMQLRLKVSFINRCIKFCYKITSAV